MIYATGEWDGKPLLVVGLSAENLKRLKKGQPILKKRNDRVLVVLYGKTEAAIVEDMIKHGMVTPDAKVHGDNTPDEDSPWTP